MKRIAVTSSNVDSIGYDENLQAVEVEFKGGRVYRYRGVPPDVWAARDTFPSIGKFVVAIKGRFTAERL